MPDVQVEESIEEGQDTGSEYSDEETPRSTANMGRRSVSVERLKEETRLVLLDFLATLPADKITARQLTQSENRPERLKQAIYVAKSNSDAAAYESNRKKFQQMAAPLRRKLSLNLKREIENFNPRVGLRRKTLERPLRQRSHKRTASKERPANLDIPNNTEKSPVSSNDIVLVSSPVLSPEGRVAAMLEKIGQEVMDTYPHLLDEPLEITRCWDFKVVSYEQFEKAARKVTLDSGLVGWSKVALLCYFAREITLESSTELTDKDLVKLAEYALRFIDETTGEWIETQGGWAGLEVEEDLTAESLAYKYREQEDTCEIRRLRKERLQHRNSRDSGTWNTWTKYGLAAIALGVGLCYSLTRH